MIAERRADPFGVVALAAAGTMTAHELGYLVDGGVGDDAHAYFGLLGPVVILSLCLAGWLAALRVVRRDPGRRPSLRLLAGLQGGAYLAMEIGERLTTDSDQMLIRPAVVAGLLLQPVVAWAALRLLDAGRRVLQAWFVDDDAALPARSTPVATPVLLILGTLVPMRWRVRGPPVR